MSPGPIWTILVRGRLTEGKKLLLTGASGGKGVEVVVRLPPGVPTSLGIRGNVMARTAPPAPIANATTAAFAEPCVAGDARPE